MTYAMKTTLRTLAAVAALLPALASCQDLFRPAGQPQGTLVIALDAPVGAATRSGSALPDVGGFLLTVTDAGGRILYDGPFDHSPDEMEVPAGSYTVSAVSGPFDAPAYDAPQWGDTRIVTVAAGGSVSVTLTCRQLNAGLRLETGSSFRRAYPTGSLVLNGPGGSLPHPDTETRTAYFQPGTVSLVLEDGGSAQPLFTRTLEAQQILTVHLGASMETPSGGIALQVDTARTWLSEQFTVGGAGAADIANAYDIATARTRAGEQGVWVRGYIVGVATGTGKVSFTPPFTKNTNLVLGAKAATSDTDYCLSVELRSGAVRNALNLMDNPGLLGRKVYIKGDLVSAYYGIPGLKAPLEYQLQ